MKESRFLFVAIRLAVLFSVVPASAHPPMTETLDDSYLTTWASWPAPDGDYTWTNVYVHSEPWNLAVDFRLSVAWGINSDGTSFSTQVTVNLPAEYFVLDNKLRPHGANLSGYLEYDLLWNTEIEIWLCDNYGCYPGDLDDLPADTTINLEWTALNINTTKSNVKSGGYSGTHFVTETSLLGNAAITGELFGKEFAPDLYYSWVRHSEGTHRSPSGDAAPNPICERYPFPSCFNIPNANTVESPATTGMTSREKAFGEHKRLGAVTSERK